MKELQDLESHLNDPDFIEHLMILFDLPVDAQRGIIKNNIPGGLNQLHDFLYRRIGIKL